MINVFRIAISAVLLALLAGAGALRAEPYAWGVNSRGNLPDNQDVHALWRVDLANGQAEYIGWTSFLDLEGLAIDAEGTLYGADDESNTLVTVSTTTGLAIAIGNQRSNLGVPIGEVLDLGMTFTCEGELLVSSDLRETLYSADLSSGSLSAIGNEGDLGAPITDIAAWGDAVYGIGQGLDASGNADSPNLYSIDAATGTATLIGPLGPAAAPYANAGLGFDAEGQLWAMTDRREGNAFDLPSEILQIDVQTGAATKIADADVVGFESLAIAGPGGCDRGVPPAVVVPMLGPTGLGALALMLLFIGWTLLAPRR